MGEFRKEVRWETYFRSTVIYIYILNISWKRFSSRLPTRDPVQIDELRTQGVGNDTGLPGLAVFDNQSSGKSSVLEAFSTFRFPTRERFCTRHPTEIMFRSKEGQIELLARIIPAPDRDPAERSRLLTFHRRVTTPEGIDGIFHNAAKAMGLGLQDQSITPLVGVPIKVDPKIPPPVLKKPQSA